MRTIRILILWRILSNFLSTSSIIFIHGLQGHPRETWTHRTSAGSESETFTKTGKRERLRKILHLRPKAQPTVAAEQSRENSVFWPFDLLRGDCPNARIITWGYNSVITKFFDGAVNQGSIFAHAKDLLFDLSRERRDCVRWPTRVGLATWVASS